MAEIDADRWPMQATETDTGGSKKRRDVQAHHAGFRLADRIAVMLQANVNVTPDLLYMVDDKIVLAAFCINGTNSEVVGYRNFDAVIGAYRSVVKNRHYMINL